ncbi:hypothetical protein HY970_01590 [Candidatus Kaiserbacteria bacterium]|nr:hypothetical protein [Candidatus Kaiserbacteria bacterium]
MLRTIWFAVLDAVRDELKTRNPRGKPGREDRSTIERDDPVNRDGLGHPAAEETDILD